MMKKSLLLTVVMLFCVTSFLFAAEAKPEDAVQIQSAKTEITSVAGTQSLKAATFTDATLTWNDVTITGGKIVFVKDEDGNDCFVVTEQAKLVTTMVTAEMVDEEVKIGMVDIVIAGDEIRFNSQTKHAIIEGNIFIDDKPEDYIAVMYDCERKGFSLVAVRAFF